ncbi:UBX domain-containing protein 4 [Melitaea cinxia]|uniref:UBX domain-containing protein 4 n=1 Tax=Melitaea cinxia TaxID=113334 RepID=UPI001E2749BF|nr:UBX domain-containing protein 4 [Melitaea cinxia]
MNWFGGSMAEAVTLSKQKNAIFVVFVEGDNDLSKELATTIDDGVVMKRLADPTNFLAVKLKSGSDNYTFFAQIYQFVPVPSLFFIGRNGTPLEVVCAGIEPQNLATRIDRILQEHRKESPNTSVEPSTSSSNVKDQTANFLQFESTATKAQESEPVPSSSDVSKSPEKPQSPEISKSALSEESESGPAAKIAKTEHNEMTKSGVEYEVVCEGDVCVRRPKGAQPGPSGASPASPVAQQPPAATESSSSTEEKIEKAKELIEIRRREKADKEKELERQKELERRAVGQGVAELKRWQAEQEMKQIQEERKRERMENNLARQRILDQIAQDRAERRAREQPPAPSPVTAPVTGQYLGTLGDVAGRARVQFKLPDGSAHTAHFDSGDTLADLQQYVADNLHLPPSSFSLWTAFPRRELTQRDASLLQLQLAPSAALLAAPPAAPLAAVLAFITQLFTSLILNPTYQIYNWFHGRFIGAPPTIPPDPSNTPNSPNPPGLRRRGNIHRLTGDSSADDDNNTWNGNSTQQM